jgi:hypothetical protein
MGETVPISLSECSWESEEVREDFQEEEMSE